MTAALIQALLALECATLPGSRRKALQWLVTDAYWRNHSGVNDGGGQTAEVDEELRRFPEEFTEIVVAEKMAPGQALLRVKDQLGPSLAADVRGLLRARGAAAHPVAKHRCSRVLGQVRATVSGKADTVEDVNGAGTVHFDIASEPDCDATRLADLADLVDSSSDGCSQQEVLAGLSCADTSPCELDALDFDFIELYVNVPARSPMVELEATAGALPHEALPHETYPAAGEMTTTWADVEDSATESSEDGDIAGGEETATNMECATARFFLRTFGLVAVGTFGTVVRAPGNPSLAWCPKPLLYSAEEEMNAEFALENDSALETFLNVLVDVMSGGMVSKDVIKQAFNGFIRARVSRGDAPSEAKAETVSVLRGSIDVKKAMANAG